MPIPASNDPSTATANAGTPANVQLENDAPSTWPVHLERELARYRDGEERLGEARDPDARQKQLTRLGNAAAGAGLALLMQGEPEEAAEWLLRASERYRDSYAGAPPASWGRPIGSLKARMLAGNLSGALEDARWALRIGAARADSPIGRYVGCLALLVLGRDAEAGELASALVGRDDFPDAVGRAMASLAAHDAAAYDRAVREVLASFESREAYLEDIPVADTVLVLQALARSRDMAVELESRLLPPEPRRSE